MKIASAAFLIMMFFMILPRAKHMLKNSPKGSSEDWRTVILLLGGVVVFIWVLMKIVWKQINHGEHWENTKIQTDL